MIPAATCAACDAAIRQRQEKARRTLREVTIRDELVKLAREAGEHLAMQRPLMLRNVVLQQAALIEELDELHAFALGIEVRPGLTA